MIEIKYLTKRFKDAVAVERVSLKIKKGEVFGFLGPNGAGKTTLIAMLSTLLKPGSGTAIINGHDILKKPQLVKRDIGLIFQETSLDERLTGRENLEIQAVLYDVPKEDRKERIEEMVDLVGLGNWTHVPVGRYSGGMKRRLEIARCLLHKPKVLLLDEPTLGLDPTARSVIWRHIQGLKDMTVVIATNYIEEAEMLCDRIGIIDAGNVVALGAPKDLKSSLNMDLVHIRIKNPEPFKSTLLDLPYVKDVTIIGDKVVFSVEENKRKDLLDAMTSYDLESIEIRKPDLSDVFLHYTGKNIEVAIDVPRRRQGKGRRRK